MVILLAVDVLRHLVSGGEFTRLEYMGKFKLSWEYPTLRTSVFLP